MDACAVETPLVVPGERPPIVAVLSGAFNPIHLGHVLLAVTVRETRPVDEVVVVPVFKHPVKTGLLPFEDRVAMCRLPFLGKGIVVSTIEQEVGESNAAMLRALRSTYQTQATLLWVCGDDVFDWIENVKGQEMLREVDGLIIQRRLHRDGEGDNFYKTVIDRERINDLSRRYGLRIDIIFGELPHFSSTLVRRSLATWKAYLPRCVVAYLDERPHLLAQLLEGACNSEGSSGPQGMTEDSLGLRAECNRASGGPKELHEVITSSVMLCLALVHAIQRERTRTALALSLRNDDALSILHCARRDVDSLLQGVPLAAEDIDPLYSMIEEMSYASKWLTRNRRMIDSYMRGVKEQNTSVGWLQRVMLVQKYDVRLAVLISDCEQLLAAEVSKCPSCESPSKKANVSRLCPRDWWNLELYDDTEAGIESAAEVMLNLFGVWVRGKEALGREQAFVCAGGLYAHVLVRHSLKLRSCLANTICDKEKSVQRIFSMEHGKKAGPSETLHALLPPITAWEWSLMRSLPGSTPLRVVHQMLLSEETLGAPGVIGIGTESTFDQEGWFDMHTTINEFMLAQVQGLAASICAVTRRDSCD